MIDHLLIGARTAVLTDGARALDGHCLRTEIEENVASQIGRVHVHRDHAFVQRVNVVNGQIRIGEAGEYGNEERHSTVWEVLVLGGCRRPRRNM